MSNKVKCTCGWSWNKSDSSKKDMYVCHECGRDNSNNMQNGGWLDNYNDSQASAPEGMVGDGFSNVGRNYSPAWGGQFQEGGEIPIAQKGLKTSKDSIAHQADKILKYEQLRGGPGGIPLPQYGDSKYMNMLMGNVYPEVQKIMPNASAMETGEAMDFVFNAGWDKDNNKITKDPRAFALQEYYKKYDPSKLDKDGKWTGRKNAPYSFDQEYANTIAKLPENQRRILMNKGRDWYYQNINNPSPGVPSSDYNDTWHGRIWNTNDYKPFDPNNPKFTPKKQMGGDVYPVNYVPQAQGGKELTFLQPTSEKLPQGYRIPYSDPSSERAMSIGGENGEPAYLIPSFKYGKPLADPIGEFRKTKEHLGGPFKTYQEADKWENEIRHPAVEKGENIMFPQEQFQMGGTIAGAPGFSYARTQGAAPYNGPGAKKTMASAQNGKEMQYYQNGLDFQPKTISKNGSWLSKYDVAQDGDILDKFRESHPSVRSIQNDAMNRKIQQSKGRGKETVVTKKDNTRTVTPKEIKKLSGRQQNELAQSQSEEQARKDWVQGSMEEAYKSPLMSPGYFTPEGVAIGALQGAFKMPGHIAEGDYKGAAIDALMALPIGIPAAKKLLPRFTPKQNYTLPEIESELNLNVNQPRINQVRSTPKVKKKLLPQWTETQLDNGLIEQTPLRKGINQEVVKKVAVPGKGEIALKTSVDTSGNPVYYFSADVPEGGLSAGKAYKHLEQFIPKGSKILEKKSLSTDSFYNIMQRAKNPKKFTWVNEEQFVPLNNAGKNKLFSNSDKIVPGSTNVKFENFNEAQKALNEFNSRITIEGMPKAKLSKIVDDFQPVENGPWIKKTTFGIDAPNIGLIKEYKQGGIIKDDRGQWDHPWKDTEISGDTMRTDGYGNIPLYVVPDVGEPRMVYPNTGTHTFPGATKFTEYPKGKKAKNGVNQADENSLVKLDQLTNFTNYNKPTPGGWLNKYN